MGCFIIISILHLGELRHKKFLEEKLAEGGPKAVTYRIKN